MKLRFLAPPSLPYYQRLGDPDGSWYAGEVRELPEDEASRVLSDFGHAFEVVEDAKPAPIAAVIEEPPKAAVIARPRRSKK